MLLNMEKNILTEHYPTTASKGPVVEVLQHLSAATLDIIGQAGFGYDFHSLDTGSECGSELSAAFSEAVRLAMTVNPVVMFIVNLMAVYVPPVVDAPVIERNRKIRDARKRMEAISGEFLKSKKKDIEKELENEGGNVENPEKDSEAFAPKDLLHVLMKANMAADLEPSQRLTDEELAGQVTTVSRRPASSLFSPPLSFVS